MRMFSNFRRSPLGRLALVVPLVAALGACAMQREPETREIGLDLWTGDPAVAGVSLPQVQAAHGTRTITGPKAWADPKTGQTVQVYERSNAETAGVKTQYFMRRPDGQALGRVYDSRPGRADRYFVNDAFFPLGTWGRGESRTFQAIEYTEEGPQTRIISIKIRRLDFTYRDVPHSLRYDWIMSDDQGNVLYNERYVYSPGKGFASFDNRLK
ncbi:hypothetical protein [Pelagibius marinus]|uniref:hypothetical protein n=1 Tax=Pelagibius marinus TaxID=2762760 RepID=UPI0018722DE6|nr:hypothetical protein [Pelagibius marinus]